MYSLKSTVSNLIHEYKNAVGEYELSTRNRFYSTSRTSSCSKSFRSVSAVELRSRYIPEGKNFLSRSRRAVRRDVR